MFPQDFQELYNAYECTKTEGSNKAKDIGSFWKNVFLVQADYDRRWASVMNKSTRRSLYASSVEGYEADYSESRQRRVPRSEK